MAVNPGDPQGDFRSDRYKDDSQFAREVADSLDDSPAEEGARKAEEYERDQESLTPEEVETRNDSPSVDPKAMGVGASSVGPEIYERPEEQTANEARWAREYKDDVTVYNTESRGDDNRGFRRADDATRDQTNGAEQPLEDELRKKEDQIELNEDPEDRSLARDKDRQPTVPE